MDAVVAVRRRIADAILRTDAAAERTLGEIELRPHQVEAVRRLRTALNEHGGVLLSDAPGLGKTYTALAVARSFADVLVVAPAALKGQWHRSAEHAGMRIAWQSLETLSRRPVNAGAQLLIVDEAHHLRNPRTRRYAHAAQLCSGKRVLLLSATPVHNRPADRDALLALFLGTASASLSDMQLAQLIIRRVADPGELPRRSRVRWIAAPDTRAIGQPLRALAPPLPAADGRAALALIRMSLAHAWSSSVAALDATARRATLQAAAIDDALAVGRWPTRRELRAWVTADDSSQLAFPELMATLASVDFATARSMLSRHCESLAQLRATLLSLRDADAACRADALRALMRRHGARTLLAFSRYAATISALWHEMRLEPGVVAITSRGVRSAGGGIRREELLAALSAGADDRRRLPLRLVLSTDLLGEGLDLPAASVIVHLDLPWTAARLDQREGRATRLGSPHHEVAVYAMRPPPAAARLLAMRERIVEKRRFMDAGLAAGDAREALCAFVRPWLAENAPPACTAAVAAPCDAWVAVVRDQNGGVRVIADQDGVVVERDGYLLDLLSRCVDARPVGIPAAEERRARRAIREWLRREQSAHITQARGSATPARAAIARRFDAALRQTPLTERSALQARFTLIVRALGTRRGAGVERRLSEAARGGSFAEMLERVTAITDASEGERPAARRTRVLALLIFVRDARAATGPNSAPRSAASSGIAAPR